MKKKAVTLSIDLVVKLIIALGFAIVAIYLITLNANKLRALIYMLTGLR
jgi:hypothetical protein